MPKYHRREFGRCPRYLCRGAPALPMGPGHSLGEASVKLFCGSCEDVYSPVRSRDALVARGLPRGSDDDDDIFVSDDGGDGVSGGESGSGTET